MIDDYLIAKTGSMGKLFNQLGNLKLNSSFETLFVTFTLLMFNSEVGSPFNKGKEVNLKQRRS